MSRGAQLLTGGVFGGGAAFYQGRFPVLVTGGVFGSYGVLEPAPEQCVVQFALGYGQSRPWPDAPLYFQLSHDLQVKDSLGNPLFTLSSHDEFLYELSPFGLGSIALYRQANCYPLDGSDQASTHYRVLFPDGRKYKIVVPDQYSAQFLELSPVPL